MNSRVDVEEMQTTSGEKFLAVVLAAFLLMGGLWVYFEPLDRTDDTDNAAAPFEQQGSAEEQRALAALRGARSRLRRSERVESRRLQQFELRREDYRTALEAGEPAEAKRREFERGRSAYESAQRDTARARRAVQAAKPPALRAEERIAEVARRSAEEAERQRDARSRETFLLRLGWVLLCMVGAFQTFARMRRRRSRYFALGMASVGFATVQAMVMATDYTTDYVEWDDVGPLVLSLAGVALTVGAFVGLQRYLVKRVPQRRVKRGECPFCGHPVRDSRHCEGCGREVVAECSTCSRPRRVGARHCGVCGSA